MGNCFGSIQQYASNYRMFIKDMRRLGEFNPTPKEYGESLKKRRKKKK